MLADVTIPQTVLCRNLPGVREPCSRAAAACSRSPAISDKQAVARGQVFDTVAKSSYNGFYSQPPCGLGDLSLEGTFSACMELGRAYDFEGEHSLQDARLALRLFDLMAALHHLDDRHRDLLYCAGLLHDIGYTEGYWEHHKTAYKLIMQAELPGLTEREKQIVANVARYHRGAAPTVEHKGFAALDPDDREAVTMLGAILRLADGLDRSHKNAVRDLDVRLEDGRLLVVLVDCPLGCDSEIWAGEKKGRLFGEVFGVQVRVCPCPFDGAA